MNARRYLLFLGIALGAIGMIAGPADAADVAPSPPAWRDLDFVNHGVAAPVANGMCVVAMQDHLGKPFIFSWILNGALLIDAQSGQSQYYPVPIQSSGMFAYLITSDDRFYSVQSYARDGQPGSAMIEFDIGNRAWKVIGYGPPRQAMSLGYDTRNDIVYAALYPDCQLLAYNRKIGQITNHGILNEEAWPQYPSRIVTDSSGWVYVSIGKTRGNLVALNPKTGEKRQIPTDAERGPGEATVHLDKGGNVYGNAYPKGQWFRLFEGRGERIEKAPPRAEYAYRWGWQYRMNPDFADGSRIMEMNFQDKVARIRDRKTGRLREVRFDYPGGEANIYNTILGPDGKIYGNTGNPLRIFVFDPEKNCIDHWGIEGIGGGHVNAFVVQKEHLVGSIYGNGQTFRYNPNIPRKGKWDEVDANPRLLHTANDVINRPHAILAHSDGRHIVMGGTPGYGKTGGGLLLYDLDSDQAALLEHEQVVPLQSPRALVELPDRQVLGGTTIAPGTGGKVLAKECVLFLLDVDEKKVSPLNAPVEGAAEVRDMIRGGDGLVYGIARIVRPDMFAKNEIWFHAHRGIPVLFVFDPGVRGVVHTQDLSAFSSAVNGMQSQGMLARPGDGFIYVFFSKQILRVREGTFDVSAWAVPPVGISQAGGIKGGRMYFSSGSDLWSFRIR